MKNENKIEDQEQESKKVWANPELKTFGTIAEITQTFRCHHGRCYPCPICTPNNCGKS
ncbi:hypothetical protein IAD21_01475 [Abditibacteriota bacterium]|nr:hypothetical protein IAD21_01475 [Abditibacteriota bacterium]